MSLSYDTSILNANFAITRKPDGCLNFTYTGDDADNADAVLNRWRQVYAKQIEEGTWSRQSPRVIETQDRARGFATFAVEVLDLDNEEPAANQAAYADLAQTRFAEVSRLIKEGKEKEATNLYKETLQDYVDATQPQKDNQSLGQSHRPALEEPLSGNDVNGLIQSVMRNAYQDNQQDLQYYAAKVQYFNSLRQAIRKELSRARQFLADHTPTGDTGNNALTQAYTDANDKFNTVFDGSSNEDVYSGTSHMGLPPSGEIKTIEDMNNYIRSLEDGVSSVGDDAQLAQIDLQNMAQRQQQTLQTLSNLAKIFHDISMAIIRNMT